MPNSQCYEVRGFELDSNYLLKPYHIASYFQNTMAQFFADNGVAAFDLQEDGKTWVLSQMSIEFLGAMPRWRDKVKVNTWTGKIKGFRVFRDFTIEQMSMNDDQSHDGENRLIARGSSSWLVVDQTRMRPEKLDVLPFRFTEEEEMPRVDIGFRNFEPDDDFSICGDEYPHHQENSAWRLEQQVRSYDIDFNNHVNNVRYIAGALECIPFDLRQEQALRRIDVKYTKEAKLDDIIIACCKPLKEHGDFGHILRDKQTGEEICRLLSHWE